MATYKITTINSRFVSAVAMPAFFASEGTPGADTLIIDPSAYLFSQQYHAIELGTAGAWTVTINGFVTSLGYIGIYKNGGTDAFSVTIGAEGTIQAGGGIYSSTSGAVSIKNAGIIDGSSYAINIVNATKSTISNTGIIDGDIEAASATIFTNAKNSSIFGDVSLGMNAKNSMTNAGTINGSVTLGLLDDTFTNSGSIGMLFMQGGTNKVTNSGLLTSIDFGNGNDTLTNSGSIGSNVAMMSGKNSLTNSGSIGGNITFLSGDHTVSNSGKNAIIYGSIESFAGTLKLTNAGKILDEVYGANGKYNDSITNSGSLQFVYLYDGADVVTNSGTISMLQTGDGNDIVKNSGTIVDLYTGSGDDIVINTGITLFPVNLGPGDDKYTGGSKADYVVDGEGKDTINLGSGNDTYQAAYIDPLLDGLDVINGGDGIDDYVILHSGNTKINLDTVNHSELDGNVVAKNSASSTTTLAETVIGFENARGGAGNDIIYGNAAANELSGNNGNDSLAGFGGNDILSGGSGNDILYGGAGADILYGGSNSDTFLYRAGTDSTPGIAKRDVIHDFTDGDDLITLAFDANTKLAGHQNFSYIGFDNFDGIAGQLRVIWSATGYMIEGDTNGDAKPDFQIEVRDSDHSTIWNFSTVGSVSILQ